VFPHFVFFLGVWSSHPCSRHASGQVGAVIPEDMGCAWAGEALDTATINVVMLPSIGKSIEKYKIEMFLFLSLVVYDPISWFCLKFGLLERHLKQTRFKESSESYSSKRVHEDA
jgi:hypothetical protein